MKYNIEIHDLPVKNVERDELKNITDPKVIKRFKDIQTSYELGVIKASKHLNVSRQYLYKWRYLYESHGVAGLYDKSRSHKYHPQKTSETTKNAIIKFVKHHQNLTYQQIAIELEKIGIIKHWMTINKICRKEGLDKAYAKNRLIKHKKSTSSVAKSTVSVIPNGSLNIINRRINDMYKMHTTKISSKETLKKRAEIIYDMCRFHFDRISLNLPENEDDYKNDIIEIIIEFIKKK